MGGLISLMDNIEECGLTFFSAHAEVVCSRKSDVLNSLQYLNKDSWISVMVEFNTSYM